MRAGRISFIVIRLLGRFLLQGSTSRPKVEPLTPGVTPSIAYLRTVVETEQYRLEAHSPRPFLYRLRLITRRFAGLALGLAGIAVILYFDMRLRGESALPELSRDMSYGLLFVVGFLTGFHCVGMCGALVLSYATKAGGTGKLRLGGHLLYGAGKTLSYMLIGAAFGLAGSVIAFTPEARGLVGMAAGVFLFLFGLSLLNLWPSLRNFRIKTPPALLKFIGAQSRKYGNPFVIGLLNGLMIICGPLQAMYIMAAGTGSALQGAKLMAVFGLGTLPVMLGFGVLTSVASARLAPKIIRLSGAIVLVLGVIMFNRGLGLTGSGYDFKSGFGWASVKLRQMWGEQWTPIAGQDYQVVEMELAQGAAGGSPIVLQKGVPVRWKIHNPEVQSCVSTVVVPKLGLDIPIKKGDQTV
ncbi:MAG: Heavy metal transport/detoxification protein, partial [Proteobacteria bacterium]|nr:Heavy metal transport/detoxification protein [Pseudomonadota bacterium]